MAVKKSKPAPHARPKAGRVEPFAGSSRAQLPADELRKLIAEAAYYRAKQRGFAPGYELQDWVEAEAEVMVRIGRSP